MKKLLFFLLPLLLCSALLGQLKNKKIETMISKGDFSKAEAAINEELVKNKMLKATDKLDLKFEIERMNRIRLDFTKGEKEVVEYIKKYIPVVTKKDLKKWEDEKSLEVMQIDGKKMYFDVAARNLFRINKLCKEIKDKKDTVKTASGFNFDQHLKEVISEANSTKKSAVKPIRYRVDYTVTVNDSVVPVGEVVRCWLPFPREVKDRQEDVKIISGSPENYIISDNDKYMHRSVYMEGKVEEGKKLKFAVSFEYTFYAHYNKIEPEKVKDYNKDSPEYKEYISQRAPHIIFTNELKKVSAEIVGNEKNPYLIAKKIFEWVNNRTPWASAREYSTIRNIPMYCFDNKHGDCGIQTLLFMTLARMNGIPTRWQSGWTPTSMHDWCQMYIEPYGWVPVDQSSGLQKSDNEDIKWFYLGNTDNRRLIVNDEFSAPFYPAKIYPRSETVDFQRGELEWTGGNLYFNQWNYDFKISEVK
jgi:hypothetical protein